MPWKRYLPLICLLLAICLVYSNSFSNSFHFDDFHTITDNPAVRSLSNIQRIFRDTTAFSVLPANQTYRPLVTTSLALDYALGHGYVPFWFHLSTLVWFLLLVSLLFLLFRNLLDRVEPSPANEWLALGIAAWFGLHPAMAETVNYIIQRGDLYCTLGCVAALFAFALWPARRRYGLYLVPFALAMLSKPPAAVFPVLLLLYVYFFERSSWQPGPRLVAAFKSAVPSLLLTSLLLWLQSAMTPKTFLPSIISPSSYRLTQALVWARYATALFLPLHLNVDTDLQPITTLGVGVVAGLLFVAGLLVLIVYAFRRPRLSPVAFGLLWFAITQLPTSIYPLSEVENDHRMFFSFPGLMLAVVWGLHLGYTSVRRSFSKQLGGVRLRPVVATLAGLCLCGYAYGAHRRNAVWRSEESLWADDVAKSPHNGRGLMIYGLTRMNVGDNAEALRLFTEALQYTPNYPTLEINLGVVNGLLASHGQPALNVVAERHFERAIALAPSEDTTHAYYGRWLLAQNRLPEAIAQLQEAISENPQRALQRDLLLAAYEQSGNLFAAQQLARQSLAQVPDDAAARNLLQGGSVALAADGSASLINASLESYRTGHFEQSIEQAKRAALLDPHSAAAWNNIGAGYGALHQWEQAIAAEEQAVALDPALQIAQNNLQWFKAAKNGKGTASLGSQVGSPDVVRTADDYVNVSLQLSQQGRYEESLQAAQNAVKLDPRSAVAWNNIAAADEALRRWDQAIAAAQQALTLRPDFQLAKNNLEWSQHQKAQRH